MKPDKEISRLKRQLETQRSENTRLQERLRAKDNDLDTAEARIVEFKKSESTAQSEILLAKQRIGVLESLASTTSEELSGTLARVERENANLAGSLKHANDRIKTLIEDRDPIREARDMLKTQLAELGKKFDALSREHGKMDDARNRLSEKHKELLDDKRALEGRVETHNVIKDKFEEEKKGLEREKEGLQLKIDESENLVSRIGLEKRDIEARLDDSKDLMMRLKNGKHIIAESSEKSFTLEELLEHCNSQILDLNELEQKHERLKVKYKEVKDGALRFKDLTSGQLMTDEQVLEMHQKAVQDHKTLEQKYNSLSKRHSDLIVSDATRKKQDVEQYNALEKEYNEAKEKADNTEKTLAKALRRHCRAMCAMEEEKNAEIQKQNDRIEVLTTGIKQIGTISLELLEGSLVGRDPI